MPKSPTDAELKDNAQQLAWLALGFFQALLQGEAKIVYSDVGFGPNHRGSRIEISVDWTPKPQEETV
jgi:hypothetical protein